MSDVEKRGGITLQRKQHKYDRCPNVKLYCYFFFLIMRKLKHEGTAESDIPQE